MARSRTKGSWPKRGRRGARRWAFAEQYVGETTDLAALGKTRNGRSVPLRDILVHMIEEYARHCGQADLLRECIDGRVGQ